MGVVGEVGVFVLTSSEWAV